MTASRRNVDACCATRFPERFQRRRKALSIASDAPLEAVRSLLVLVLCFKLRKRHHESREIPPIATLVFLCRGNRSSQQHTIDLSDVVDVLGRVPACQGSTDALQLLSLPGHIPMPSAAEGMFQGTHAYSLHSCPGCIVFPGWLTAEAQLRLAADAFCCFPEPPARTNHNAQYGGLKGLWHAAQADKVLESVHGPGERPCEWHWTDSVSQHRNKRGGFRPEVLPARRLLRHLRWASLGPQYGVFLLPNHKHAVLSCNLDAAHPICAVDHLSHVYYHISSDKVSK